MPVGAPEPDTKHLSAVTPPRLMFATLSIGSVMVNAPTNAEGGTASVRTVVV